MVTLKAYRKLVKEENGIPVFALIEVQYGMTQNREYFQRLIIHKPEDEAIKKLEKDFNECNITPLEIQKYITKEGYLLTSVKAFTLTGELLNP